MSKKAEVIKLIENLPDDVTIEEIMKELFVRMKIEKGLQELDEGKSISHHVVRERLGKWLD